MKQIFLAGIVQNWREKHIFGANSSDLAGKEYVLAGESYIYIEYNILIFC